MKVLPTIQIVNGRMLPQDGRVGGAEPALILARLLDAGCQRIVFVDVDAAKGQGHNRELIATLMRQCRASNSRLCIQVGGGIRGSDQAQFFLDQGASWLLIGTLVLKSPLAVGQLLARFHEHLTAAINTREGEMLASGWVDRAGSSPAELARWVQEAGFRRVVSVDVPTETSQGPDLATARLIADACRLPTFLWGAYRGIEDMRAAAQVPGIKGLQVDAAMVLDLPETLQPCHVGNCS